MRKIRGAPTSKNKGCGIQWTRRALVYELPNMIPACKDTLETAPALCWSGDMGEQTNNIRHCRQLR